MSRFFDLVSNAARNMQAHQPALPVRPTAAVAEPRLVRLDSNENPYGPSLRAMEATRGALAASNCYPDDDCTELRRKLADHHTLLPEQVLVTAGSTALLGLLCQTMLGPGLNAVTSERSFIVYALAVHAAGAQLIEAPMRDDGFDLDSILAAINSETRLVFLANPNNPTGTMFDAAAAGKFLAKVPGHVVVVLDEAYFEFALHFAAQRRIEYSRSLEYVREGASVVVLRTFSKAHGLAGMRIGYGMGPAELLAYCARMRNTFSVSSVAQAAAIAALDDLSHIGRAVHNNAAQADMMAPALSEMGCRVTPTAANFVYCDVGEDAAGVAERLRAEGVSVRPLGAWGAPTCMRVSIGTPEQNYAFLEAMRKIAATARATGAR
jgi:histidinol-phosphate aminotransferase